jgi:hypothetical protein
MPIFARFRVLVVLGRLSASSVLLLLGPAERMLAEPTLRIVVLEGDGAINNVRTHTAHDSIIEVRNEQDRLVPGASVTFQTPATGASAEFDDGMRSFITQTDGEGRAATHRLRPNSITGPYEIRVNASFQSQTANAVITQTNAAPAEAKSSKKIWLIGLAAGAAAGGAFAASHGAKSSSNASIQTATTGQAARAGSIVAGSPSFGPPH